MPHCAPLLFSHVAPLLLLLLFTIDNGYSPRAAEMVKEGEREAPAADL